MLLVRAMVNLPPTQRDYGTKYSAELIPVATAVSSLFSHRQVVAQEVALLDASEEHAAEARDIMKGHMQAHGIPAIILSHSRDAPHGQNMFKGIASDTQVQEAMEDIWEDAQLDLARDLSKRATRIIVHKAGHHIAVTHAPVVVDAISAVLNTVNTRREEGRVT